MSNPSPPPDPDALLQALRTVQDPEHGVNIVDLGLIYAVHVEETRIRVDMTLTSPACPMGSLMAADAEAALRAVLPPGYEAAVAVVWDPPWDPARMSDAARAHFGWP